MTFYLEDIKNRYDTTKKEALQVIHCFAEVK